MGAESLLVLPFDPELARAGEEGRRMQDIPRTNPVLEGINGLITQLNPAGETRGRKNDENG